VGEHEGHEGYLWMGSVDAGVAGGGPTMVTVSCQWWQWCSGGVDGEQVEELQGAGGNRFWGVSSREERPEGRARRGMVEQQQWRATVVSSSATVS
jgi:hypothetical protein